MSASAFHDRSGAREGGIAEDGDQRIVAATSYLQRSAAEPLTRGRDGPGSLAATGDGLPRMSGAEWQRQAAGATARLIFVLIVFLVGLFVGATFGTDLPAFMRPEISISLHVPAAPTETTAGAGAKLAAAKTPVDNAPARSSQPPSPIGAPPKPTPKPTAAQTAAASSSPAASRTVSATVAPAHGDAAADHPASTAAGKAPPPAAEAHAAPNPVPVVAAPVTPVSSVKPPTAAASPPERSARAADGPADAAAALVASGDALLAAGDAASARLFYRRGSDAGNGMAALRMGETFDPAFLARARLGRIAGDPAVAAYWYRRARELGNAEAAILLQSAGGASGK